MNKLGLLTICFAIFIFPVCAESQEGSQGKDFTEKVNAVGSTIEDDSEMLTFFERERNPIQPAFEALPTGSNLPKGWLVEMMENDLHKGIVGALGELYPGIKADDLYHTARRGGMEDIPEMGDLKLTGEPWEKSIMWWNAETIGNWWDGYVRHAFMVNDEKAMKRSQAIVENLLASQDEDGYIGIYKPNLRYQHDGSNGELWAQTTAFRMLLAYYEITGDKRVLIAVEKAMSVTMKNYNSDVRNPFELKNAFGGVTHGLMMTDVCETLFRITNKEVYQSYSVYLYQAFSTFNINRAFNDVRYPFLIKKEEPFTGHGVHTYEHLRTLLNAYYSTGYDELKTAYENAMYKLDDCILPSGAGHAMEWIAGLKAEPSHTATEYCTMLELRNFYGSAALKTGEVKYADQAEKLTFNAMLGARSFDGKAIAYGKHDNCYKMDGKSLDGEEHEVRYKYSPTHSEPAVCCVPNYTRNLTYYLDQMWGKKEDGLAAIMYGPSVLKTTFNEVEIKIEQVTEYPYSNLVRFKVTVEEPVDFTLYLRKPSWTNSMRISGGTIIEEEDFYKIEKTWDTGDKVYVMFENKLVTHELENEEVYFQRGPLVYALEILYRQENIKDYFLDGFHDYHCFPLGDFHQDLVFRNKRVEVELESLNATFYNIKTQEEEKYKLVPMGNTVLRRVTFPVKK